MKQSIKNTFFYSLRVEHSIYMGIWITRASIIEEGLMSTLFVLLYKVNEKDF